MTKVRISEYFLIYQTDMAELVRESVREKYIGGVKSHYHDEPPWIPPDLLPPPQIEKLEQFFYEGHANDVFSIYTSDDFGLISLVLTFQDEHGNLIESGDAFEWPDEPNHWAYLTSVAVPEGTVVTVTAVAIDGFGGMSSRSLQVTVRQHKWGPPTTI